MDVDNIKLARKYAVAFLNVYEDKITIKDYYKIVQVQQFLAKSSDVIFHFKLPDMNEVKRKAIDLIFQKFDLPIILKKLSNMLIEHERLFMLEKVFYYIQKTYKERNNLILFQIQTSYALSSEVLNQIISFLEKKTGNTILYETNINRKLIAGIRLQSETLLWEDSIAKRLRHAEQLLNMQGLS
ncbi:MAG: F0F1 ATP synthase subunit delta [Candidatus Babeliales bacterium]